MSSRREAGEPWASAMKKRGMIDRGRPSMRQLAERAGLSVETVRRAVYGSARSEVETVEALAEALGLSASRVSSWVQVAREADGPWVPPAEASLLTPKMRAALDQLIRAMAESEARSDATPMTRVTRIGGARADVPEPPANAAARRGRLETEGPDVTR